MSKEMRESIDKFKNILLNEDKNLWKLNVKVKISDILPTNEDGQSIEDAIINIKDGLKSHSNEFNVSLLKVGDKYQVLDGFHRIAKKILDGETHIIADVKKEEKIKNGFIDDDPEYEYGSYRLKNKLKNKLLYFGGDDVELGLDTDEELVRMLKDGVLFDVDVVNLKGGFGLCHRNVADKYKRFSSGGFKIVTGYALSNGIWFQHSWGLGSTGKIMETTGNKYDMYYGYILNEEESDEFCFYNY